MMHGVACSNASSMSAHAQCYPTCAQHTILLPETVTSLCCVRFVYMKDFIF